MVKEIRTFIRQNIRFFPTLVALVALRTAIGGLTPFPTYVLFVAYTGSLLLYFKESHIEVDNLWMVLLLYLPFTIMIGQPHPVFQSWPRLVVFCSLFLCVTPVIQSQYARKYRSNMFMMAVVLCIIISYASFVAYFLGINLFSAEGLDVEEYYGVAGLFGGITKQSMLLGPISGFSAIFLFAKALSKKSLILWASMIPAFGCILFSASRSALGATLAGCLVLLYYKYNNKGTFVKYLLGLSLLASVSFPLWQTSTVALQNKQAFHMGETAQFDSRTGKVEARLSEFQENPISGVGFAAFNYNGKDSFDKEKGSIEPGSSWLALLSMTGLIGFILFFRIYIRTYKRIRNQSNQVWLVGLFTFFSVHMLVEGYIYAGGSALAFLLWLTLGQCYDSINNKNNI